MVVADHHPHLLAGQAIASLPAAQHPPSPDWWTSTFPRVIHRPTDRRGRIRRGILESSPERTRYGHEITVNCRQRNPIMIRHRPLPEPAASLSAAVIGLVALGVAGIGRLPRSAPPIDQRTHRHRGHPQDHGEAAAVGGQPPPPRQLPPQPVPALTPDHPPQALPGQPGRAVLNACHIVTGMDFAMSAKGQDYHNRLSDFMTEFVFPAEESYDAVPARGRTRTTTPCRRWSRS